MSAITLDHVSKSWGAMRAVNEVSLTADEGSLLVLLGPSGCGKSTTLRLIAGLRPDRLRHDHHRRHRRDASFACAAQDLHGVSVLRAVSASECRGEHRVRFARAPRARAPSVTTRLKRVADIVGLSHLLERKPSQLSGGQRQRVALGRAIIAEARVCLMDEPLSNLDAKLRHEMRTEIRSLQQRLGMTMVYVTHDQTEAMTMADRVVLMRDGRVEQNGTPEELYNRPATCIYRELHRHAADESSSARGDASARCETRTSSRCVARWSSSARKGSRASRC